LAIDFSLPSDVGDLCERVQQFIRAGVIPAEAEAFADSKGPTDALRRDLQDKAAATGLLAHHLQPRWGGLGLDMRGQGVVFEEAGYSLLGLPALNCAGPDEGNGHLLAKIATDELQWRYLAPLARCEIRSSFAMTEPPPGAGSGPSLLATMARQVSDGWVINGEECFLTGADGAPLRDLHGPAISASRRQRSANSSASGSPSTAWPSR
jgi:acyl-CoA dehydrogenase